MSDIPYSTVRTQHLPIQESAVITQRDPNTNRFLSPWTLCTHWAEVLCWEKKRQLCLETAELFLYHKYYILTLPIFGFYQQNLPFKCQAKFTGLAARNKQNKTLQSVNWTSLLWHCSSHTERHKAIVTDFFPEYSFILKLLLQIHNSNPMFCFKMEFQPY